MEFEKYLTKGAKELDREVERILEGQLKKAEKTDKKLVPLLKAFIESCQGGKRIRGVLVKLGYELAEGRDHLGGEILEVAAAYEIAHAAILVHDDIIDQSKLRRDKPSLYQTLGGDHYGVSQAITLADYGFFLAFKIISDNTHLRGDKAAGLFSKIMMDTAFGQMLELKKADPRLVMKLKTACYTISGPLQVGAILAGAEKNLVRILGDFGEKLGIAYQIKDDMLDDERKIKEGVGGYINQAMKMVPEITKDSKMSKILEQMAEYLVRRTK